MRYRVCVAHIHGTVCVRSKNPPNVTRKKYGSWRERFFGGTRFLQVHDRDVLIVEAEEGRVYRLWTEQLEENG